MTRVLRFPVPAVPLLAVLVLACGPGGGTADDLPGADALPDGASEVPLPADAIPVTAGPLDAPEDAWIAAGSAWSRATSAATQMVVAVNGLALCSVDHYGPSPRQDRLDAALKSVAVLADAGTGLAAAADALDTAVTGALADAADLRQASATAPFALAVRDAAVVDRLRALADAATAESSRVQALLAPLDVATMTDAALDGVAAALAADPALLVAAGPVVASAGTVTRAVLPAPAPSALAVDGGSLLLSFAGELPVVGGLAEPDGTSGPVPLALAAPSPLAWRADALPPAASDRAVAADPAPDAIPDGTLATLAFPYARAATLDTRPLDPAEACWTAAAPTTPACALAATGLLPAGIYVDRDGGGAPVTVSGLSPAVARRIATGLPADDRAVALPDDPEAPAPAVASLSPLEGPVGTAVTLSGTGFGTDPAAVRVRFDCGQWARVAPVSVGDTLVTAVFPDRPTLDAAGPWCTYQPSRSQGCGVSVDVGGRTAWGNYFTVTGLPACAPSLLAAPSPAIASVGDPVKVYGYGFSPTPAANQARFAGGATAVGSAFLQDPYESELATVTFVIPEGAVTGDVSFRNTEGIDAWSSPEPLSIVPATVPVLLAGPSAAGLHDPAMALDADWPTRQILSHPDSWVLGHRNLGALRSQTYWTLGGHVTLDVTTRLGSYSVAATVLDDARLLVPNPLDSDGILARLEPGDTVTLRVRGMEMVNLFERVSDPLVLPIVSRYEAGTVHRLASDFQDYAAWNRTFAFAVGDVVVFTPADANAVLSAPGLIDGTVPFKENDPAKVQWDGVSYRQGLRAVLAAPGSFTVTNETGATIEVQARREGAEDASALAYQDPQTYESTPVPHLAQDGARLACGGARIDIPPGALPLHDGEGGYQVSCNRAALASLGEAELTAGGLKTQFAIDPEPPELLLPVTITIPFDPDARGSDAEMGLYDPQTGLYATLPSERDGDVLRLVLPAGPYGDAAPASLPAPSRAPRPARPAAAVPRDLATQAWPLPALSLNQVVGSLIAAAYRSAKGVLRDDVRQLQVNYVSTPGAASYVTDAYAGEVLYTAQAAWDYMTGAGWPKPDGWFGGLIVLTITDLGPASGTKGSTTKGVFGQPWVRIGSGLASGPQLDTTTAHEMGHVFQRQVNNVFTLKWIDEAAAQWTAVATLGSGADISQDIAGAPDFPALSLPTTFGSGYDEDQAYAAGALGVWMESVSKGSLLRVYEQLRDSYLSYGDARGTLAAACGRNVQEITSQFGLAYWTQDLDVLRNVNLGATLRTWIDWTGMAVGDARPPLSSRRFDIGLGAMAADLAGRDLVVRASGLGAGQAAYVYTDTRSCNAPDPQMQQVRALFTDHPNDLVGVHDPSTLCYRVVVLNFSSTDTASPSVWLAAPQVAYLVPDTGKNAGGYPVTIAGYGFGDAAGQVTLGGFTLAVTRWTDTSITATMLNAGTMTGPLDLKVTTAESARSNAVPFTLTN